MTLDILFITPNTAMMNAIRQTYAPIHDSKLIDARPVFSFGGTRAKKVIVLPFPDHWSAAEREAAEAALEADARCRLVPGGEYVRL